MNISNLQSLANSDKSTLKEAQNLFKKILQENTKKTFISSEKSEKINVAILIISILSVIYFIFSLIKSKLNKSPKRLNQIINLIVSTFFLILSIDLIYKINNFHRIGESTDSTMKNKILSKLSINISIPNLNCFITISILNIFAFYGITTFIKKIIDLILYSIGTIIYIIIMIAIGAFIIYKNKLR